MASGETTVEGVPWPRASLRRILKNLTKILAGPADGPSAAAGNALSTAFGDSRKAGNVSTSQHRR